MEKVKKEFPDYNFKLYFKIANPSKKTPNFFEINFFSFYNTENLIKLTFHFGDL